MIEALLTGWGLGLAAGISPGPLLTLVVTATLERGLLAGWRVASAPLWSDAPVIIVSLWLVSSLVSSFLGGIGLLGGGFVVYLGIKALWRARRPVSLEPVAGGAQRDILTAVLVNLLSPSPWLFWLTVGGPLSVVFWRQSAVQGVAFVAAFYSTLVGSKGLLAVLVASGRQRLEGRGYRLVLAFCGLLMVGLGIALGIQGWGLLQGEAVATAR